MTVTDGWIEYSLSMPPIRNRKVKIEWDLVQDVLTELKERRAKDTDEVLWKIPNEGECETCGYVKGSDYMAPFTVGFTSLDLVEHLLITCPLCGYCKKVPCKDAREED